MQNMQIVFFLMNSSYMSIKTNHHESLYVRVGHDSMCIKAHVVIDELLP